MPPSCRLRGALLKHKVMPGLAGPKWPARTDGKSFADWTSVDMAAAASGLLC